MKRQMISSTFESMYAKMVLVYMYKDHRLVLLFGTSKTGSMLRCASHAQHLPRRAARFSHCNTKQTRNFGPL